MIHSRSYPSFKMLFASAIWLNVLKDVGMNIVGSSKHLQGELYHQGGFARHGTYCMETLSLLAAKPDHQMFSDNSGNPSFTKSP